MKSMIITAVLMAALSLSAGVQAESVLAMGSKGSAVQPRDNKTDVSQPASDHEGKKTGDDLSSTESGTPDRGKPPPEKKPRLKYRDAPGCSC